MTKDLIAQRLAEGLNLAQCAQGNFDNLVEQNPQIKTHPMYAIARMQLDEAVAIMEGGKLTEVGPGTCGLCLGPMPKGEEMMKYHGLTGPCPPEGHSDGRN